MNDEATLVAMFSGPMKRLGFRKQGRSWRRVKELAQLVNLQKSAWGALFYVNVAVGDPAQGEELGWDHARYPLRMRLEQLCSSTDASALREICLDRADSDEMMLVRHAVEETLCTFLEISKTRLGLLAVLRDLPPGSALSPSFQAEMLARA